jgi:hypothetical protein
MKYDLTLYFYFFSNFYLSIYVFAAILLLIGASFLKNKFKTESYNLLYVFNTLVAWCSLFILIYFAVDLFVAWYGQNSYQWYYFRPETAAYSMKWFYFKMYFPPLIGLFLFIRKLRINRLYTLFFLFFFNIWLIEKLVNSFRDYVPSSWSTYYQELYSEKFIKYVIAFLLLTVIYFIAKKRNKLPNPSVFLK